MKKSYNIQKNIYKILLFLWKSQVLQKKTQIRFPLFRNSNFKILSNMEKYLRLRVAQSKNNLKEYHLDFSGSKHKMFPRLQKFQFNNGTDKDKRG